MDREDEILLSCLGASAVDRESFEQSLLNKLEQQYTEKHDAADTKESSEISDKELEKYCSSHSTPQNDESELVAKNDKLTNIDTFAEKSDDGGNDINIITDETDKKIRDGEMTPFGTIIEKSSPKKNSFMEFSKYLESQKKLQLNHGKAAAKKITKGNKDKKNIPNALSVGGEVRQGKSSKTLNMNVLFPKKKRKQPRLETAISDNPSDSRKRPAKQLSERSAMYFDPEEDSDYIPSESDASDSDHPSRRSKRIKYSTKKTKSKSKPNCNDSYSSSSEYEDDDKPLKTKNLRKEADDGNIQSYQKRIQKWKENETRFTGEFHTFEEGFKIPMHLWESLYSYQNVGVKWLYELHQQRCGGILGDEMGMGKTIQVITFLAGLSCSKLVFRFSSYRGLGPSIIVCPATVMHQWVKEFHTWWPPFRVAILHESGSYGGSKNALIQSIQDGNGILITSYIGIVSNQNEILKHQWHYIILDEGHKIRNPDAQVTLTVKQIKTPHRLILSGSPLQNNLKELWSLFDFVYPGKLGLLPDFIEKFSIPITQGGYSNASQIQVSIAFKCATVLRDIINPYLLRRMKADVKKHLNLPEKTEQVLFCKMTTEQRGLYISYINSKEIDSIIQGRFNMFVGMINLRKICNHPHLFDGGPKIIKANSKRIPKNRANMKTSASTSATDDLHQVEEEEDCDIEIGLNDSFGHWGKSGKMIVVETLLRLWKTQNHKVLLFTQSRQMLCILENFVRRESYNYLRLDGGTSIGARQPLIKKFNEDTSVFVFILTTRVGGLGINLTGANRIILFDPDWNPSTDAQAKERSWRIGQERQVTIYRLITSGTIEEKIYHRQIFKQFLANRVLKDPKQKRFFKSNDMLELFSYNEGTHGTESESIFAGTGSNIRKDSKYIKRMNKSPREKSSGKLRDVPHLVKQSRSKSIDENEASDKADCVKQDEYVLQSLFSKSGVEAALRHDKIVETDETDYMILEQEAERVANDAVTTLKKSRARCFSAESGQANWTGSHGTAKSVTVQKPRFGSQKKTPKVETKSKANDDCDDDDDDREKRKYFAGPSLKEKKNESSPMSSSDLLAIIRNRNQAAKPISRVEGNEGAEDVSQEQDNTDGNIVSTEHLELLRDIHEYISFRGMVDGQATTSELLSEFADKLPPENSPLFKQMLSKLCTFRRVEGKGVWRLKPEFR